MPGRRNKPQQDSEPVIGRPRGRGRGQSASRGRNAAAAAPSTAAPPPPVAAPTSVASPAAATASQVDALASQLEDKAHVAAAAPQLVRPLVHTHFPPRPGFGKLGKPVQVYANHFRVDLKLAGDVFHYDVAMAEQGGRSFGNDGPPKALANQILQTLVADLQRQLPTVVVVSDARRNLYTPTRLPFATRTFDASQLPADGGRGAEVLGHRQGGVASQRGRAL
uniref:Protein argonaute N-terminal domain-containing protein n=1 Tax=Peronospora matthiolae TaxID=2874970 RepID=A0AAV1UBY4_9STRA